MANVSISNFRVSSDFQYKRNVVLGNNLERKYLNFPWHASVSDSLELEIFVAPDPMTQFSEAFFVHPPDESVATKLDEADIFDFVGGMNLEVLVTPSVITSDESLKAIDPSDRSCYMKGERKLIFFKIYSIRNCEIECYSNYSLKACNCVHFNSVRGPDTRVCGITEDDLNCLYLFGEDFTDLSATGMLASCSCLPPCDSVTYNFEVIESKFRENEWVGFWVLNEVSTSELNLPGSTISRIFRSGLASKTSIRCAGRGDLSSSTFSAMLVGFLDFSLACRCFLSSKSSTFSLYAFCQTFTLQETFLNIRSSSWNRPIDFNFGIDVEVSQVHHIFLSPLSPWIQKSGMEPEHSTFSTDWNKFYPVTSNWQHSPRTNIIF